MKLSALGAPARGVRRLASMVFRRNPMRLFMVPRSNYDYAAAVGDGTRSSTVMAPLLWMMRAFPEAPPSLCREQADGQDEPITDHEMLRLLRRPNPFFSGPVLWMATLADYVVDGNAYWLKIRDKGGQVRELWWAPRWMVEPKGDESTFISRYEYRPGGGADMIPFSVDDVVHFRFGADADDARKGYSPLKSVLREVFTDEEAANFTASLLRNMGVPGIVVSPEVGVTINDGDAEETKKYVKAMFTGDKRGEALVMTGATKIQQFGFSPEQLTLKELRRVPEERVSAVIGVPAIVAGLGAGLDRSTFTNYKEAREAAYEQAVIPLQRLMAEELWFQLLPDFEDPETLWSWKAGFDLSNVRALQEDRFNLARRLDLGVRGGWILVSSAKRANGEKVLAGDDIYLRQMNLVAVPADGGDPTHYTPAKGAVKAAVARRASSNGHADLTEEELREVMP